MPSAVTLVLAALLLQPSDEPRDVDALADAVMKASGGDVWPKVARIKFTFNVEREGKIIGSNQHDWDVRAGTDTVTSQGKATTTSVRNPAPDGDGHRAYSQFINDYWLLAPLKVNDPGVKRSTGEAQEIDGKKYMLLHLSFDNVGLTPTDQYNLWVDPKTNLVRWWDFMPAPGKSARISWDDYRDFNGLKLATKHVSPRATITFTDIEVIVE